MRRPTTTYHDLLRPTGYDSGYDLSHDSNYDSPGDLPAMPLTARREVGTLKAWEVDASQGSEGVSEMKAKAQCNRCSKRYVVWTVRRQVKSKRLQITCIACDRSMATA